MALSETVIIIFAFVTMDIACFDFSSPLIFSLCSSSELHFKLPIVFTEFTTRLFSEFIKKQTKSSNLFSKQSIQNKIMCGIKKKSMCGIVYTFAPCFRNYWNQVLQCSVLYLLNPCNREKIKIKNPFPPFTKMIQTRLLHHWYIPDVSFTNCTHALH